MLKNQALGGRTNRALIFLGLFLGLVSAALVVVYLSKANEESGGSVSGGATTPVVVASQDIPAGTRITEDMISVKPVSKDALLPEAYRDVKDVVDQITRVPLVAGEQVIPVKVAATGVLIKDTENPPLAYVVPEGMRAVSVQVSSIIGASGLIRPGDYVDVILTVKIESGATGDSSSARLRDQIATTVLQNAQVLSIDQSVAVPGGDEGSPSTEEGSEDANPEASTVTLAVSPVHGEVLTVAEACGENFDGRLALALRAFGDSSPLATRTPWANDGQPPTCAAMLGLSTLQ